MKITESFVGTIEKLQYVQFENKNELAKASEPIIYICNATISEVGRGMAKFKQLHNAVLYLTKKQFDLVDEESGKHNFLEKGDRINILEGCKWQSTALEYKSYHEDVIRKVDKSKLKVDSKGKTYYSEKVFAYKIICKQDAWSINTKWYDQNYCTIYKSGVKLPLENKQQFMKDKTLDFFLDPPEMDRVDLFNEQTVKVIAYSNGNKFAEKQMSVKTDINQKAGTYYLLLENAEVADEG